MEDDITPGIQEQRNYFWFIQIIGVDKTVLEKNIV